MLRSTRLLASWQRPAGTLARVNATQLSGLYSRRGYAAESQYSPTQSPSALAGQITSNPAIMRSLHKLIAKMETHGLSESAMPTEEQWESLMNNEEIQSCLEELRTACDEAGIGPGAHVMEAMAGKGKV